MYDKHGLRRFHGAFEGGWSAGYYNTVGSKEGWTPRQWSSTKDSQKASNTIEDYQDDEDESRRSNKPEIVNIGPELIAKWDIENSNHFEIVPEAPKTYQGPGGLGYDSRLVDITDLAPLNGSKRLLVSTNTPISLEPGSGKKRPLLLEDEDEEELFPTARALPKLRKEKPEASKSTSLVVKHKFLSAKERKLVSTKPPVAQKRARVNLRTQLTCSDGKLPLTGFIVVSMTNEVFSEYGLDSIPVTETTLQNQVDSFLDSIALSVVDTPYKSKLDSKFQLAGSAVQGPKQDNARTTVQEWVPSKMLCKRMGVRYEKVREEDEVERVVRVFGKEKVERMRQMFQ